MVENVSLQPFVRYTNEYFKLGKVQRIKLVNDAKPLTPILFKSISSIILFPIFPYVPHDKLWILFYTRSRVNEKYRAMCNNDPNAIIKLQQ